MYTEDGFRRTGKRAGAGFKHGIPVDTDFVFDLRCLPNPHWQPALRQLTGRHEEVVGYLQSQDRVNEMFQDIFYYLQKWIPRFADNDRVYVTVGIGCTGGQHRSVYMAELLAQHFRSQLDQVLVRHRELDKI